MPTIHNRRSLDAPPELVFDLMADYERYPEWVAIVEEATLVKGDRIETGAEYEEVSPLGPFRSTSHWRVTAFDPPRRQIHVGQLPFGPVELTIEMRPDGQGGTVLDHTVELTAFPRFRPLGWLLERLVLVRVFERDMEESLTAFAELVENETGDAHLRTDDRREE